MIVSWSTNVNFLVGMSLTKPRIGGVGRKKGEKTIYKAFGGLYIRAKFDFLTIYVVLRGFKG